MSNYYQNAIEKLKKFYTNKLTQTNAYEEIFEILSEIIPLDNGEICFLNGEEAIPIYVYNKSNTSAFKIKEPLSANSVNFGIIQISRKSSFNEDEIIIFKTCASIIANLIKEMEMNSILKTQLKMLEQGIKNKNDQYLKIEKAEKAKNQFISNVSHELRSPLNSIIGFTDLLHSQFVGKLNSKQLEYVDDIRIASLHLLNMVNEILDMSKIESGTVKLNISKFNLFSNIKEVLNILEPLYSKKNIDIIIETNQGNEITADYQKIQQILINLLSNAIKFTPENGKIKIKAQKSAKYSIISIKDNGIGIEKKYQNKIFNKFTQIAESANSTGLGLTIVKELVEMHNGKISVKSKPNKGSEFIVKLPNI